MAIVPTFFLVHSALSLVNKAGELLSINNNKLQYHTFPCMLLNLGGKSIWLFPMSATYYLQQMIIFCSR